MNQGLVLVCDLDGVVFDFDRTWTRRHAEQFFHSRARPGLPQEWDQLHLIGGFDTREEFWSWWYESGGFKGLTLYPGAAHALWVADGRDWFIIYATNRPTPDTVTAEELIRSGLPQAHHLSHTQRKWEISGDLYLEDAPGNISAMMEAGCRVVPVRRPWNQRLLAELDPAGSIDNLTAEALFPWLLSVEALGPGAEVGKTGT